MEKYCTTSQGNCRLYRFIAVRKGLFLLKKAMLLLTMALLMLMSSVAVQNYSSAEVDSQVSVTVANPHALISLQPNNDISVTQGCISEDHLLHIANHLNVELVYELIYGHDLDLSLSPEKGTISPGESTEVYLQAGDQCQVVDSTSIDVTVDARFDGGRAVLKTTLTGIEVEAGDLDIDQEALENDGLLIATWNQGKQKNIEGEEGGDLPEEARFEYRHCLPEEEFADAEERWTEIPYGKKLVLDKFGEYQFRVRLGETYSEIESKTIDPPEEAPEDAGKERTNWLKEWEQERNTPDINIEDYFKHEVKDQTEQ